MDSWQSWAGAAEDSALPDGSRLFLFATKNRLLEPARSQTTHHTRVVHDQMHSGPHMNGKMVNGQHLYSVFIQSALQLMLLIDPFTHTHKRRLAAMQGTNKLVRSNWGLGVLLKDTSTSPGWDRTGNPPTARRLLIPPAPMSPCMIPRQAVPDPVSWP